MMAAPVGTPGTAGRVTGIISSSSSSRAILGDAPLLGIAGAGGAGELGGEMGRDSATNYVEQLMMSMTMRQGNYVISGRRKRRRRVCCAGGAGGGCSPAAGGGGGGSGPCAACKLLRRKCRAGECVFAPYFPPEDPHKFASVHKVFGASNVSKLLLRLSSDAQRSDAVTTLVFEAEARLQDPVYGCVAAISLLQRHLLNLQQQLAVVNAHYLQYGHSSTTRKDLVEEEEASAGEAAGPTHRMATTMCNHQPLQQQPGGSQVFRSNMNLLQRESQSHHRSSSNAVVLPYNYASSTYTSSHTADVDRSIDDDHQQLPPAVPSTFLPNMKQQQQHERRSSTLPAGVGAALQGSASLLPPPPPENGRLISGQHPDSYHPYLRRLLAKSKTLDAGRSAAAAAAGGGSSLPGTREHNFFLNPNYITAGDDHDQITGCRGHYTREAPAGPLNQLLSCTSANYGMPLQLFHPASSSCAVYPASNVDNPASSHITVNWKDVPAQEADLAIPNPTSKLCPASARPERLISESKDHQQYQYEHATATTAAAAADRHSEEVMERLEKTQMQMMWEPRQCPSNSFTSTGSGSNSSASSMTSASNYIDHHLIYQRHQIEHNMLVNSTTHSTAPTSIIAIRSSRNNDEPAQEIYSGSSSTSYFTEDTDIMDQHVLLGNGWCLRK